MGNNDNCSFLRNRVVYNLIKSKYYKTFNCVPKSTKRGFNTFEGMVFGSQNLRKEKSND